MRYRGINIQYLATQSSSEEVENRWRNGCCSRHHDPHLSPQRLLKMRTATLSDTIFLQVILVCCFRDQ